jgi:integrase
MTTTKQLQTPTARRVLTPRGKPYFVPTGTPGLALGYRRIEDAAGSWTLRKADGAGGNWTDRIGTADDLEAANGEDVLAFADALDKARQKARGQVQAGGKPVTVLEAIAAYEAGFAARGRNPYNARRLKTLVPEWLAGKDVAALKTAELERFRDTCGLKGANLNRTLRPLKAALTAAAERSDGAITNVSAWKVGLAAVGGPDRARDVRPLTTAQVNALIDAAYREDEAFGLFVEVGAETGARPSQIARIRVGDLQADRIMVPSSRKGREGKEMKLAAIPITAVLAARLRAAAADRGQSDPLLLRDERFEDRTWGPKTHEDLFRKVVMELGLPSDVTFYVLRHTAVCRQILAGVRLRLIAARLDTSTEVIEKNYSAFISDADDEQMRRGLLERTPRLSLVG